LADLGTYRKILAVFIVTVYAFISVPVQFWHHHTCIAKNTANTISANTKGKIFQQASGSSSEANCPICSHKYSVFNNPAFVQFETLVIAAVATNGCYSPQLISASSFLLPNKGPPVSC
jgi:hypothetical protein